MKNSWLEVETLTPEDRLVSRMERELMRGKAKWLANFNESFRNYRVNDVTFDVYIRGNTRVKGFLLSRLFSFLLNPNYEVGCFIFSAGMRLSRSLARKIVLATKSSMNANEMKWGWLLVIAGQIENEAKDYVEDFSDQGLAVVAVATDTRMIINSSNFLGRQARKFVRV